METEKFIYALEKETEIQYEIDILECDLERKKIELKYWSNKLEQLSK